jgi:DUF1680 family protein
MKSIRLLLLLASGVTTGAFAQSGGLTDMSQSRFAKMANTELGAVHWTDGFWGDRFNVYSHTSLQSMWDTWNNPDVSHGFRNFEIAAGVCEGEHWGPPFHDGDMYKWMEGVASVYAVTKDPELDKLMDHFIEHVVKAQRADGYIHTPVIIEEKNKGIDTHSDKQQQTVIGTKVGGEDEKGAFANRLNFETYNLGHLMMAGIIHRRATGKTTLFDAAVKATDFLCHFYETASAEQSGGLTDMSQSRFAKMANTELGAVHWTDGFWGDRFNVYSHTSLQSMWDTWNNPDVSHGFRNFEIAAGVCEGEHWGPPFHDGDMYKWMEGVASVYAVTKDPELDKLMDHFIEHVVKAQRADGYIHTPVIIEEKNKGIDTHSDKQQQTVIGTKVGGEDEKGAFANRLNFETYNLGHLMMAGIIHRRATGLPE